MFWSKKKQDVVPSPSDIVASLVAARMIASPQRIRIEPAETAYGTRYRVATWADEKTGIVVKAKTGVGDGFASAMYGSLQELSHRGIDLAPSGLACLELRQAVDTCCRHNAAVSRATRQYEGDMAACDAVQELAG